VDDLRSQGFTSVRAIAAQLNERGILTPLMASDLSRSVDVASANRQLKRIAGRTINEPHALSPFGLKSILRSPFPQNVD
jgi:hypothetical protein